jgi:host factor-I protein
MTKHNINIQGQIMALELVTGRQLLGRLKRFDRFAVVIETEGKEILIYKHAIATIALAAVSPPA